MDFGERFKTFTIHTVMNRFSVTITEPRVRSSTKIIKSTKQHC